MKKVLFILLCGLTSISHAQSFGYMGKKNIVSFSTNTSLRVISSFADFPVENATSIGWRRITYNELNQMDYKSKPIRWDMRLAYSRVLSKHIGLGVEMTYANMRLGLNDHQSTFYAYYGGTTVPTTPIFNAFGGYLVFDMYSSKHNAPLGFMFSVGIGPRFYSFDSGHNYRLSNAIGFESPWPEYKKNMMGIHAFVGLTTRKLLTSFLAIDYGMRVNIGGVFRRGLLLESGQSSTEESAYDLTKSGTIYAITEQTPLYSKSDTQRLLNGEVMGNLISLKLGVTFIL